jgi:hypothetical protein
MFLFGKQKDSVKIIDSIFMKEPAKWNACLEAYSKDASLICIAWFEETQQKLQAYLNDQHKNGPQIILYRQATGHLINNKTPVFIEHFPLHEKESILFTSLNLTEVRIFSSLDEPLFQYFGGNKIMEIMEKTGVTENESLQHPLITTALKNAQEKIAKKITIEQGAQSQSDWFKRNLK